MPTLRMLINDLPMKQSWHFRLVENIIIQLNLLVEVLHGMSFLKGLSNMTFHTYYLQNKNRPIVLLPIKTHILDVSMLSLVCT